jgi:hypothetical protein
MTARFHDETQIHLVYSRPSAAELKQMMKSLDGPDQRLLLEMLRAQQPAAPKVRRAADLSIFR